MIYISIFYFSLFIPISYLSLIIYILIFFSLVNILCYWLLHTHTQSHTRSPIGEVGILLGPRALKMLNSIERIQPRMMAATFNGNPKYAIKQKSPNQQCIYFSENSLLQDFFVNLFDVLYIQIFWWESPSEIS